MPEEAPVGSPEHPPGTETLPPSVPSAGAWPSSAPRRRDLLWETLHLFSLCGIAFAQPMLDRLQHNPGYLAQERLTPADITAVTAAVLLLPPLMLWALTGIARLFGTAWRSRAHQGVVLALLWVWLVSLGTKVSEDLDLRMYGVPGILVVLVAGGAAAGLWWSYHRRGWVYQAASLVALGLLVYPTVFFSSRQISAICFPAQPITVQREVARPVPVVMIVFDGLSGMALLDETHQIDAARYPNFARLAAKGTWYRNATTVHYRTDNALPALLTGRIPPGHLLPFISEYPDNLFALLHQANCYEMTIFEPYTRLCPNELRDLPPSRSSGQRITETLRTLACVYLEISFPHDVLLYRPRIPREWLRVPDVDRATRDVRTGLVIYGWDGDRHEQVEHFLRCLEPASRPTFRFLHVALPHHPWMYFPSGRRSAFSLSFYNFPLGAHGKVGEDWSSDELVVNAGWQRYLLQVQYVDRCLGRVLDRLEETGMWDDVLLVVTADHGEAFLPGRSRRDPVRETLPAILPIPLLIKYPGQQEGRIDDRNVETIDVLPTLAEVLGMDLPGPVDGGSLLDPQAPTRPRKTLILPQGMLVLDPDFPEKYSYVERLHRTFGSGRSGDRLRSFSLHPEWLGRPLSEFYLGPESAVALVVDEGSDWVAPDNPEVVPCRLEGRVLHPEQVTSPLTLVLAVNGRIAHISRTLTDPELTDRWFLYADEETYHPGRNEVRIFELVEHAGKPAELRPCRLEGAIEASPSEAPLRPSSPAGG